MRLVFRQGDELWLFVILVLVLVGGFLRAHCVWTSGIEIFVVAFICKESQGAGFRGQIFFGFQAEIHDWAIWLEIHQMSLVYFWWQRKKKWQMGCRPLMIKDIKSSSSTSLPTATSWSAQVFGIYRYWVKDFLSCLRVWSFLFRWVILDLEWDVKREAKESQTWCEVLSPKTVDNTISVRVAFNSVNIGHFYSREYNLDSRLVWTFLEREGILWGMVQCHLQFLQDHEFLELVEIMIPIADNCYYQVLWK